MVAHDPNALRPMPRSAQARGTRKKSTQEEVPAAAHDDASCPVDKATAGTAPDGDSPGLIVETPAAAGESPADRVRRVVKGGAVDAAVLSAAVQHAVEGVGAPGGALPTESVVVVEAEGWPWLWLWWCTAAALAMGAAWAAARVRKEAAAARAAMAPPASVASTPEAVDGPMTAERTWSSELARLEGENGELRDTVRTLSAENEALQRTVVGETATADADTPVGAAAAAEAAARTAALEEEVAKLRQDLQDSTEQCMALQTAGGDARTRTASDSNDSDALARVEAEAAELRARTAELETESDNARTAADALQRALAELEAANDALRTEVEDSATGKSALAAEAAAMEAQLAAAAAELDGASREVARLEAELAEERQAHQHQLEGTAADVKRLQARVEELEMEAAAAGADTVRAEGLAAVLQTRVDAAAAELEAAVADLAAAGVAQEDMQTRLCAAEEDKAGLAAALAAQQAAHTAVQEQAAAAAAARDAAASDNEALRAEAERLEAAEGEAARAHEAAVAGSDHLASVAEELAAALAAAREELEAAGAAAKDEESAHAAAVQAFRDELAAAHADTEEKMTAAAEVHEAAVAAVRDELEAAGAAAEDVQGAHAAAVQALQDELAAAHACVKEKTAAAAQLHDELRDLRGQLEGAMAAPAPPAAPTPVMAKSGRGDADAHGAQSPGSTQPAESSLAGGEGGEGGEGRPSTVDMSAAAMEGYGAERLASLECKLARVSADADHWRELEEESRETMAAILKENEALRRGGAAERYADEAGSLRKAVAALKGEAAKHAEEHGALQRQHAGQSAELAALMEEMRRRSVQTPRAAPSRRIGGFASLDPQGLPSPGGPACPMSPGSVSMLSWEEGSSMASMSLLGSPLRRGLPRPESVHTPPGGWGTPHPGDGESQKELFGRLRAGLDRSRETEKEAVEVASNLRRQARHALKKLRHNLDRHKTDKLSLVASKEELQAAVLALKEDRLAQDREVHRLNALVLDLESKQAQDPGTDAARPDLDAVRAKLLAAEEEVLQGKAEVLLRDKELHRASQRVETLLDEADAARRAHAKEIAEAQDRLAVKAAEAARLAAEKEMLEGGFDSVKNDLKQSMMDNLAVERELAGATVALAKARAGSGSSAPLGTPPCDPVVVYRTPEHKAAAMSALQEEALAAHDAKEALEMRLEEGAVRAATLEAEASRLCDEVTAAHDAKEQLVRELAEAAAQRGALEVQVARLTDELAVVAEAALEGEPSRPVGVCAVVQSGEWSVGSESEDVLGTVRRLSGDDAAAFKTQTAALMVERDEKMAALEALTAEHVETVAAHGNMAAALEVLKVERDEQRVALEALKADHDKAMALLQAEHIEKVAVQQALHDEALVAGEAAREAKVAALEAGHDSTLATLEAAVAARDEKLAVLEATVAEQGNEIAALEALKAERDEKMVALETERQVKVVALAGLERDHAEEVASLKAEHNDKMEVMTAEHNAKVAALEAEHTRTVAALRVKHVEMVAAHGDVAAALEALKAEHDEKLATFEAAQDAKVAALQAEHNEKLGVLDAAVAARDEKLAALEALTEERDELRRVGDDVAQALADSEAKRKEYVSALDAAVAELVAHREASHARDAELRGHLADAEQKNATLVKGAAAAADAERQLERQVAEGAARVAALEAGMAGEEERARGLQGEVDAYKVDCTAYGNRVKELERALREAREAESGEVRRLEEQVREAMASNAGLKDETAAALRDLAVAREECDGAHTQLKDFESQHTEWTVAEESLRMDALSHEQENAALAAKLAAAEACVAELEAAAEAVRAARMDRVDAATQTAALEDLEELASALRDLAVVRGEASAARVDAAAALAASQREVDTLKADYETDCTAYGMRVKELERALREAQEAQGAEVQQLEQQLREAAASNTGLREDAAAARDSVAAAVAECVTARAQLTDVEDRLKETREQNSVLEGGVAAAQQDLATAQRECEAAHAQNRALVSSAADAQARHDEARAQLSSLAGEVASAQRDLAAALAECDEARGHREELESRIAAARAECDEAGAQAKALESEAAASAQLRAAAEDARSAAEARAAAASTACEDARAQYSALASAFESEAASAAKLLVAEEGRAKALEQQVQGLEAVVAALNEKLAHAAAEADARGREMGAVSEAAGELRAQQDLLRAEVEKAERARAEAREEMVEVWGQLAEAQQHTHALEEVIAGLRGEVAAASEKLRGEEALGAAGAEARLEAEVWQQRHAEAEQARAAAEAALTEEKAQREAASASVEEVQTALGALREREAALRGELDHAYAARADEGHRLVDLAKELAAAQQRARDLEGETRRLTSAMQEAALEKHEKEGSIALMEGELAAAQRRMAELERAAAQLAAVSEELAQAKKHEERLRSANAKLRLAMAAEPPRGGSCSPDGAPRSPLLQPPPGDHGEGDRLRTELADLRRQVDALASERDVLAARLHQGDAEAAAATAAFDALLERAQRAEAPVPSQPVGVKEEGKEPAAPCDVPVAAKGGRAEKEDVPSADAAPQAQPVHRLLRYEEPQDSRRAPRTPASTPASDAPKQEDSTQSIAVRTMLTPPGARKKRGPPLSAVGTLQVVSVEKPVVRGVYRQLDGVVHNGYPMWGCGTHRIFSSREGYWMVSADEAGPLKNVGRLVSHTIHEGRPPQAMHVWDYSNGTTWVSSRQTAVQEHAPQPAAAAYRGSPVRGHPKRGGTAPANQVWNSEGPAPREQVFVDRRK